MRVRDEPGQARDQEDRVAEVVREAEIGRDRGDRAVDVDRQWLAEDRRLRAEHAFDDAKQADMFAFEFEFERHLKQPRRARIARMDTVAEARRHLVGPDALFDERLGRFLQRLARRAISARPESRNRMHDSMSPPWRGPNARTPAPTESFSGAPVVATLRAASVDGGVTP